MQKNSKQTKPRIHHLHHCEQQRTEKYLFTTEKNTMARNKFRLGVKLHYKPLKIGSSNTRCTNSTDISHKVAIKQSITGTFLMKSEAQQSWHNKCDSRGDFPSTYRHTVSIFKPQRHPVVVELSALSLTLSLKHHCCRSWTVQAPSQVILIGHYSVRKNYHNEKKIITFPWARAN